MPTMSRKRRTESNKYILLNINSGVNFTPLFFVLHYTKSCENIENYIKNDIIIIVER